VNLRALLLCEDVRLEADGTLTLIGVHNDRLRVRPSSDGPLVVENLAFLLVVGGLTGYDRVGFRANVRDVASTSSTERPLSYESHVAGADEHNFVFAYSPMVFSGLGIYEIVVDLEVAMRSVTYRHRFRVEAADPVTG
jgi:hypothetical protein